MRSLESATKEEFVLFRLQRDDPQAIAIRSLNEELRKQSLLADALEKELNEAREKLEEAEEANMKVTTRLASILSGQTRQETLSVRSNSQVHFTTPIQQEGGELQTTITREGYDDALMQVSQLEKQLQAMTQTLNALMQKKEEQEKAQAAKIMECKRAFG